ncbi:MAG TPA: M23 family metallopeptidase [Steroidobacteraceae bacterium]|nr:M23 family metallopeptidase [Steroidobacteraceae bacterium]
MRVVVILIVLLAVGAGGAWWWAGRAQPPAIQITQPTRLVGQQGKVDVVVDTHGATLNTFNVVLRQNEKDVPLFDLGDKAAQLTREGDRLRFTRALGKRDFPQLEPGPARIVATASRPVLFGYRQVQASASKDFEVRLTPPQVGVQSLHHFINHGGSEMVVYHVSADAATSGVRVGDDEYRGYPAAGAGIQSTDPGLRVAFFALLWNQALDTPIQVFARDEVGNEARASFDYRVFPKTFRNSRIAIDDRFLQKVVPAILQNTPELKVANPNDLVASFLTINRDLRRANNATIAALAEHSAPKILWQGAFKQLVNTAVEAGFADQRTYVYKNEPIDNQVHLGFDLASLSAAPVQAANSGTVVHAGWLGIYGNCVILDHGMGLQSLYAHLSSIDVKVGAAVQLGDRLGRTGSTGLAGGDHLHFTMLLDGRAVTPIDWWSQKWIQDRILRKLAEAGASAGAS